jgi:hypothetical protein
MHWIANGSSLGNIPALRAVKVRGREYLRIIYGPEYTLPEHLERLKSRGLGTKRFLHFPLTIEAHLSRQGKNLYGDGQSKQ